MTFLEGSRRQKSHENFCFNSLKQQDLVVGQHLPMIKINIYQTKISTTNLFCTKVRKTKGDIALKGTNPTTRIRT